MTHNNRVSVALWALEKTNKRLAVIRESLQTLEEISLRTTEKHEMVREIKESLEVEREEIYSAFIQSLLK